MESEYLLMRQDSGEPCTIVFVKDGAETVLWRSGRVAAKRQLKLIRSQVAFESVPAYNKKKGKNGELVRI